MKRGEIQVDWIIAFFIFIVFIAWSFQYYSTLFTSRATPLDKVASGIDDTIINNITNRIYSIPVFYSSPNNESGSIMYAYHYWNSDGETNTTTVLSNTSVALPCKITGNIVYWSSDVIAGQNNFTIKVSNRTASVMNCTGTFDVSNANLTIPMAGDMGIKLSMAAVNSMVATDYGTFKIRNAINRDFSISLSMSDGSTVNYGSTPPNASNVYANTEWFTVDETGNNASINILVW